MDYLLFHTTNADRRTRTIAEAKRRFEAYSKGDGEAIHPNLRLAVFSIAIREMGEPAYKAVQEEYIKTTSVDGKETCLLALGKVQSTALAEDFLNFQYTDKVAVQDMHTGAVSLASNPKVRAVLWDYIKQHWDTVHQKLSKNPVVLDRYLKTTLTKFASQQIEEDIAAFFKDKDTKSYDRGLVQISDSVQANASYKERDEEIVLEWLKAHDYV